MQKLTIPVNQHQTISGVLQHSKSERLMILVHGFGGDMNGPTDIYVKLAERLEQEGIACLRFNFRGTPPSDGDHLEMTLASETKDLQSAFQWTKDQGYQKVGALAESMGAVSLVKAFDPFLKVVVFWHPAFDLTTTALQEYINQNKQQQELKSKGYITKGDLKIGEKFIQERQKTKLYSQIKNITCPVLFMHGGADTGVPVEQSQKAYQMAREPKELDIIKGSDHSFKKEQPLVIAKTMGFLRRNFR